MKMNRTRWTTQNGASQEQLAQTILISTASRRELEQMCIRMGVPHQSQPSATLRQALKQRLVHSARQE